MTQSEPSELKWNGLSGRPSICARIFLASTAASRKANRAVGGTGLVDLASKTAAQSPRAHRPSWPGMASVASTVSAPRLFLGRSRAFTTGLGATPAVQTRARASPRRPREVARAVFAIGESGLAGLGTGEPHLQTKNHTALAHALQ